MAKRPSMGKGGPQNLFELADLQEALTKPVSIEGCQHPPGSWLHTRTVWPNDFYQGKPVERLTFTCAICGEIRGRC